MTLFEIEAGWLPLLEGRIDAETDGDLTADQRRQAGQRPEVVALRDHFGLLSSGAPHRVRQACRVRLGEEATPVQIGVDALR